VIGKRILANVQGLESYLNIVELHHENWNGTGYPQGLKETDIPLQARIVKVADAYDAMTSDRPYRRGMPHTKALSILSDAAGIEMDAAVVQAFAALDHGGKLRAAVDATGSLRNLTLAVSTATVKPHEAGEPEPANRPAQTRTESHGLPSGKGTA
jgi:HD-GYP domain-containing protein (c-di-GMP phosphodiesterase class II)